MKSEYVEFVSKANRGHVAAGIAKIATAATALIVATASAMADGLAPADRDALAQSIESAYAVRGERLGAFKIHWEKEVFFEHRHEADDYTEDGAATFAEGYVLIDGANSRVERRGQVWSAPEQRAVERPPRTAIYANGQGLSYWPHGERAKRVRYEEAAVAGDMKALLGSLRPAPEFLYALQHHPIRHAETSEGPRVVVHDAGYPRTEYWLDPERDFVMTRQVYIPEENAAPTVYFAADFQRTEGGDYVPASAVFSTADGSSEAHIITVTGYETGLPSEPEAFGIALPEGTHLYDGVEKARYEVGAAGALSPASKSPRP